MRNVWRKTLVTVGIAVAGGRAQESGSPTHAADPGASAAPIGAAVDAGLFTTEAEPQVTVG
jgi:hypothetical protein